MHLRVRRLQASLIAAAVLLTAACSPPTEQSSQQPSPTPTTSTPATPEPQPPLSVAQYQAYLTGIEKRIRPFMVRAMAATSLAAVDSARLQLVAALQREHTAHQRITPPGMTEENNTVLGYVLLSYQDLRDEVSTATVDRTNSCGLPTANGLQLYDAKIAVYYGVGDSMFDQLGEDFAKQGISFGKQLLPPSPERPVKTERRAANGQVIQRSGPRGSGRLTITNDDIFDVVISAVAKDPKKPLASIYVRGDSKATLRGIRGTYSVYFKSGTDWEPARRGFTEACSYERFDQTFDSDSHWEIKLKKTTLGNAKTSEVPAF